MRRATRKRNQCNLLEMPVNAIFAVANDELSRSVRAMTENGGSFSTRDVLIALTVGLGVGLVLFVLAYLRFRKRPDDNDDADEVETEVAQAETKTPEPGERRRRRKRRRRRAHRPRNPSLHQTGGLPPPRPDDQLPKF
jgi:hypothetical protein